MLNHLWREWVYDSAHLPIEWETHPHCAYKLIARLVAAILGSLVPVSLILLRILLSDVSDVLEQLHKGTMYAWAVLMTVTVVFVASWLIGVILATASEEKSLLKHIALGAFPPSGITVLYLTLQGVQ